MWSSYRKCGWTLNEDKTRIPQVRKHFCQIGDPTPLVEFIEQRYFPILSNRDYRWSNELIRSGGDWIGAGGLAGGRTDRGDRSAIGTPHALNGRGVGDLTPAVNGGQGQRPPQPKIVQATLHTEPLRGCPIESIKTWIKPAWKSKIHLKLIKS
jgi:hypothetical protein